MTSHFTYVFAALTFASGLLLSGIRAQSPPDYGPFDAARIGLPALTEELGRIDGKLGGYGEEIDRLKDEIEKRRKKIADLQAEAEDQAQEEAEFEKYKQTIRQQVEEIDRLADKHSLAATEKAKAGRVEDISALRADLTIILEASRFNALLGNEEKAIEQYKVALKSLTDFSSTFSREACYNQSFDPAFALGLQRQNEMLGTGIDVTPCAKRRYVIGDYLSTFENCSSDGEGRWRAIGPLVTSGEFELESSDGRTAEAEFDVTLRTPPPHVWITRRHYRVQLYTKLWNERTERWLKFICIKGTVTSPEGRTTTEHGLPRESESKLTPHGPTPKSCGES